MNSNSVTLLPLVGGHPRGDNDQINQYDDNNGEHVLAFAGCPSLHLSDWNAFAETTAEVGTIAGIVSAVAMALVGAVSSYISYQKKKLCFSIQRRVLVLALALSHWRRLTGNMLIKCVITESLNAEMVKAENPDAVVATEPQGKTGIGATLTGGRSDPPRCWSTPRKSALGIWPFKLRAFSFKTITPHFSAITVHIHTSLSSLWSKLHKHSFCYMRHIVDVSQI